MKTFLSITLALICLISCSNNSTNSTTTEKQEEEAINTDDFYFDFTVEGKAFHFLPDDILTSYRYFAANDHEFKVYVGKETGPTLTLTIIDDMSKPSATPSGSPEPGNKLFQGSVSLQKFPSDEFTFNSYEGFENPKPTPTPNAIVITKSELEAGGKARILTGTVNVVVKGGENKTNDPAIKDRLVTGKFRIRHKFDGVTF
jgi:hypothetical protein